MKKLIKLIIFLMAISFYGGINVNAAKLTFDGDNTISKEGTENIILDRGSDEITQVKFQITIDDATKATLGLTENKELAVGTVSLGNSILNGTGEGWVFSKDGVIAILNITNKNNMGSDVKVTLKITNVEFTLKDKEEVLKGPQYDYSKEITLKPITTTTTTTEKPKSNNASLTGITFSSGTLTPAFETNTKAYKVFGIKDTIKSVTINPKCDNCSFTISCESGCTNFANQQKPNLEIGKNVIKIATISESGTNNLEYTFTVYRGETTDNSAFLKELSLEELKLNEKFDKNILDYTVSVDYDITDIKLKATPEDSTAKVEIKGNNNLIVGDNVITITITSAETGDKKIYNITVTRLEEGKEVEKTNLATTATIKKDNKTLLIIIISVVALAIIGLSAYFIFFKKKNKDKKNKNGKNPEIISDEGEIKKGISETEIEIKENELREDLNVLEEKDKPATVDEALADLMTTKEIILNND